MWTRMSTAPLTLPRGIASPSRPQRTHGDDLRRVVVDVRSRPSVRPDGVHLRPRESLREVHMPKAGKDVPDHGRVGEHRISGLQSRVGSDVDIRVALGEATHGIPNSHERVVPARCGGPYGGDHPRVHGIHRGAVGHRDVDAVMKVVGGKGVPELAERAGDDMGGAERSDGPAMAGRVGLREPRLRGIDSQGDEECTAEEDLKRRVWRSVAHTIEDYTESGRKTSWHENAGVPCGTPASLAISRTLRQNSAPPNYFTSTIFLISCEAPARSEYRYVPDGSERASNVTR